MLERHFGLCAVLLCGAVLLGGCRTTNVGAETGTTPSSDTTEPGGSVTEPVTDQFETSMRIPADPDGVIPPTPRVWNASQVDNRRDSFETDTIDVCNSTYTVPQELQQKVFDVTGRYSYLLKCTFYAIDLDSGMSVGLNADDPMATASTVKAGYCYSCMLQIENSDQYSLDDKVEYRPRHFLSGSGVTKTTPFGTVLTVRELIHRTLYYSDNVAYYMLLDYFGGDYYNSLMESIGVSHRLDWNGERWGFYSAHELGLIWQAIYRYRTQSDNGALLWEYLTTNLYNEFAEELTEYPVIAHKSGWGKDRFAGFHDAGVVCTERGDYVLVVMTDTEESNRCLHRVARAVDDIMKDYAAWKVEPIS